MHRKIEGEKSDKGGEREREREREGERERERERERECACVERGGGSNKTSR